jgi:hypothetical protein
MKHLSFFNFNSQLESDSESDSESDIKYNKKNETFYLNNKLKYPDAGYLYILYNSIFKQYGDDVYKLGRTNNLNNRLKNYTTSFIEPSSYLYTSRVFHSSIKAERILFFILRKDRIREKREFFHIQLDQAISTIKQIESCTELQLNRIYNKIIKKICPYDILDKLNDEDYYKQLDFDYSNITAYLEKFRFRPKDPSKYKLYNYVPPEDIEFNTLLIDEEENNNLTNDNFDSNFSNLSID